MALQNLAIARKEGEKKHVHASYNDASPFAPLRRAATRPTRPASGWFPEGCRLKTFAACMGRTVAARLPLRALATPRSRETASGAATLARRLPGTCRCV